MRLSKFVVVGFLVLGSWSLDAYEAQASGVACNAYLSFADKYLGRFNHASYGGFVPGTVPKEVANRSGDISDLRAYLSQPGKFQQKEFIELLGAILPGHIVLSFDVWGIVAKEVRAVLDESPTSERGLERALTQGERAQLETAVKALRRQQAVEIAFAVRVWSGSFRFNFDEAAYLKMLSTQVLTRALMDSDWSDATAQKIHASIDLDWGFFLLKGIEGNLSVLDPSVTTGAGMAYQQISELKRQLLMPLPALVAEDLDARMGPYLEEWSQDSSSGSVYFKYLETIMNVGPTKNEVWFEGPVDGREPFPAQFPEEIGGEKILSSRDAALAITTMLTAMVEAYNPDSVSDLAVLPPMVLEGLKEILSSDLALQNENARLVHEARRAVTMLVAWVQACFLAEELEDKNAWVVQLLQVWKEHKIIGR